MINKNDILKILSENNIDYKIENHSPVFTVDDSKKISTELKGLGTKNIFLRNKKKTSFYLIIVEHSKLVDLKLLAKKIGSDRFSFGSTDDLMDYLNVTPGSVTMLALVSEKAKNMQVVVDQDIWEAETVTCHPMINTSTVEMTNNDMKKFFKICDIEPLVIEIPQKDEN